MVDTIKSYIPGLDEVLGGGFPRNSITALSGATGTGKSVLGVQFLVEAAKKSGELGLYITIEESKESLIENMKSFGWDLRTMESLRQLIVLGFPPTEVEQFYSLTNPIKEIIDRDGITRVVIDSVRPIALSISDERERQKAFLRMIDNIKQWHATVLLITEDVSTPPGDMLPETKYKVETLTDGWIHLYYILKDGERKRLLEVIKMKGIHHSSKLHEFTLGIGGIQVRVAH